jgi:acetylornithine deacetylase
MNIVPGECELGWEIRPGVGADLDALRRAADELLQEETAGMPTPELGEYALVLPLRRIADNPARDLAARFGAVPDATDVPFGTEAGYFQAAGVPSVVCGPGSIEQAHEPDEWIAIDQMRRGVDFAAAAVSWAGEPS